MNRSRVVQPGESSANSVTIRSISHNDRVWVSVDDLIIHLTGDLAAWSAPSEPNPAYDDRMKAIWRAVGKAHASEIQAQIDCLRELLQSKNMPAAPLPVPKKRWWR